ncbi:MAG: hypothetical protein C0418_01425 [Coriobacteriaceae bacterium]|nr:hypothetical protein [Coriobacteriaceae bacterium]
MDRRVKYAIGLVLVFVAVGCAFTAGLIFAHVTRGSVPSVEAVTGEGPPSPGDLVDEARRAIRGEALDPADDASMTVGAMRGLLDGLGDPYALYFDKRHFQYFSEESEGRFGGIGVTLGARDGEVYIVTVMPDTPAERAGIAKDDEFVSVDGVTRAKWDTEEVVKRVRGQQGTTVTIELARKGAKKPLRFVMKRAVITFPNVDSRMIGRDVGYISMAQFNARSADEIAKALGDLKEKGAKGYILDLRNDPGGMLDAAVQVSSLFVKDGVIVRVEYRSRSADEYRALSDRHVTDAPLVLLVNENSASASEIVAGALQDYRRARLVGVKTFGKGSVQTVEPLSDGTAIKFTIAHYLTPKRRVIDKKGVAPDVIVQMKPELIAEEKTDTQLKKALAVLREEF